MIAHADQSSAEWLWQYSLVASPAELHLICDALSRQDNPWSARWINTLNDTSISAAQRLRAACCLAQITPSQLSESFARQAVELLTNEAETASSGWTRLLEPINHQLIPGLEAAYFDSTNPHAVRNVAAAALADYCATDLHAIVRFLADASVEQFETFFAPLRAQAKVAVPIVDAKLDEISVANISTSQNDHCSRQQANLAIALWQLGERNPILMRLANSRDPRTRFHLLDRMASTRVDPHSVANALRTASNDDQHYSLLLALSDYRKEAIPANVRSELAKRVAETYRQHPNAGVHSAAQSCFNGGDVLFPRSIPRSKNHRRLDLIGSVPLWGKHSCALHATIARTQCHSNPLRSERRR